MIKKCPRCKSEQIVTETGSCSVCGTELSDIAPAQGTEQDDSEQLDIVVTEVPEDDREFVGGGKQGTATDSPDKDPKSKTKSDTKKSSNKPVEPLAYDPIGVSEPTLPPTAAYSEPTVPSYGSKQTVGKPKEEASSGIVSGKIKKLSEKELEAIERNLYGKNVHLADKEKASIRSKINEIEKQASEIPEPAKKRKRPLLSEGLNPEKPHTDKPTRSRGMAFFYKNIIQLAGQHHLTRHDELLINGREYSLKPKKVNPVLLYGGMAALFGLLLFFVGTWFVQDTTGSRGQIAGVVLDKSNRPYIKGAEVRFPDLGVTVETNSQGFFSSDEIPEGSHKIEYVINGKTIGSDFTTVLDHEISMIALRPSPKTASKPKKKSLASRPKKATSKAASTATTKQTAAKPPERTTKTTTRRSSTPAKGGPGAILLAANVSNARFTIDGRVLGAGNLKYTNIKPGNHKYEVVADGYKKKTGSITLKSGETRKLAVKLSRLPQKQKQKTYSAEDFFQSGLTAIRADRFSDAVSDFTEAINQHSSYPQAYFNRGVARQQLKNNAEAFDDFIRAAEIYKIKKEYNWAITSYNRAIDMNDKAITAYLGRADLYLAKGEEIAALADYDNVVKLDKRNFDAYYGLGKARFKQTYYKKAINHFKDARSVDKKNPYVYQYLMLCYMATDKYKDVKKSFDKFEEVASEKQMQEMLRNKKYTAVLEVAKRQ